MPSQNPYPGPVPLADPIYLKGRERDVHRFVSGAMNLHVIEVHGRSGVGKSSFLRAGVTPRLEEIGLTVATVSAWEEISAWNDETDGLDQGSIAVASPVQLWVSAVDRALAETAPLYRQSTPDPDEYLRLLAPIDGLVIVFDQLEELFRSDETHGRTLGKRFLEFVADVANDDRYSFVQVLSLRSEYLSELGVPIEQGVPPSKWAVFEVEPVDFTTAIPEVIKVAPRVDDALVERIHRLWNLAAYGSSDVPIDMSPGIGLLELQAYLWSMAESLALTTDEPFTLELVRTTHFGADSIGLISDDDSQRAAAAFVDAMELYVGKSLITRADQYQTPKSPESRSAIAEKRGRETIIAAALMGPHLSSAGYKLVRDTDELARASIPNIKDLRLRRSQNGDDHASLPEDIQSLLRRAGLFQSAGQEDSNSRAIDLLDHEGAIEEAARLCRIGSLQDDIPKLTAAVASIWQTDSDDRRTSERLSGRMHGASAIDAVVEMVASYERALQWLESSYVIRLTPTAAGRRVVALVHDGFGVPYSRWSRAHRAKPETVLSSLIAISGESVIDASPETPLSPDELLGGTVSHIRWLGCEISAAFTDVVFEACDFRGSIFVGSHFENVRFEECNLWGVLFIHCEFNGCEFSGGEPLQTLTLRESELSGAGVVFRNLAEGSYGLFLDRVTGGPWAIESCPDLSHVSMTGRWPDRHDGNLLSGTIRDSTITHLTLGDAVDPTTRDSKSEVILYAGEHPLQDNGPSAPEA